MDHRKARFYGIWCRIAAFVLILLAIVYMNTPWLYIFGSLGIAAGVASTVLLLIFWRCPRCRRRLSADKSILYIRVCPHCGEDLGISEPELEAE